MIALIRLFFANFSSLFKSRARLEAENTALRQQLIVLRRKLPGRVALTNCETVSSNDPCGQGVNCHEPLISFVLACRPEGQGCADGGQATAPFHTLGWDGPEFLQLNRSADSLAGGV